MAALNDVFRIAARMFGPANQDFINVWHVQITGYVTGTDAVVAQELVDELSLLYQPLEAIVSNTQTDNDMSVVNVTTSAVLGSFGWTSVLNPAGTGDRLPPQSSAFGYFRTGISRRIGRKFWGVVPEATQDNGLLGVTTFNNLVTLMAGFVGTVVGGTTGNSYKFGVYNDNLIPQFLPFTEAVAQGRLMTQRRRRPTVGS